MTSFFPAFTRWQQLRLYASKVPGTAKSTLCLIHGAAFPEAQVLVYLSGTAILHLPDLRQGTRDQRYLKRSSGLATTDVAYSINFIHLPVSVHIDASMDKKANSSQLSPAKMKMGRSRPALFNN